MILAIAFGAIVRGRGLGLGQLIGAGMAWGAAVFAATWFVVLPAVDPLMLNLSAAVFFVGHLMWGAALGYIWSRYGAAKGSVVTAS